MKKIDFFLTFFSFFKVIFFLREILYAKKSFRIKVVFFYIHG